MQQVIYTAFETTTYIILRDIMPAHTHALRYTPDGLFFILQEEKDQMHLIS